MDSMVLIHLAKITLLELCCKFFGRVLIPELVYNEVVTEGKIGGYTGSYLVDQLVDREMIRVERISDERLIQRANQFNIQRGEAEALSLYWEQKAGLIASDDDNLRRKKDVCGMDLIGTPSIVLELFRSEGITREKLYHSINELRRISWFSNVVLDKIIMEVEKNE